MDESARPLPRARFTFPVRGTKAMDVDLDHCRVGQPIELVAEPTNPYDCHAVQVVALPDDQALVWERALLGYVPRELARRMDPDEWVPELSAVLKVPSRRVR